LLQCNQQPKGAGSETKTDKNTKVQNKNIPTEFHPKLSIGDKKNTALRFGNTGQRDCPAGRRPFFWHCFYNYNDAASKMGECSEFLIGDTAEIKSFLTKIYC